MTNTNAIHKHARVYLDRMLAQVADYEAEVEEWYTYGDGRPTAEGGRGYTFPHCVHGMSRWTDYDNICWGCEEGALSSWESMARDAIAMAQYDQRETKRRVNLMLPLLRDNTVTPELRSALLDWGVAHFPQA